LGIEEVGKVNEKLFDIFPNPTSNTLNLKINEKYIGNTANIVIYSLEGHTVFRNDYSAISAIETIETKEWLSGTYIALLSFYNTKPYQISFTKQ
jgi:hypothetical protein